MSLAGVPAISIHFDPTDRRPLHRQLYDGLRELILAGRLPPGSRLPATRLLAVELGLSRNTVLNAFEQLLAEGYLEGRVGAGTYVAPALPDETLRVAPATAAAGTTSAAGRRLSRRGEVIAGTRVTAAPASPVPRAFRPGVPAWDAFPFAIWERLVTRHLRRPPVELLGYGDPAGYRPLRAALGAHLAAARAVRCAPEQVIVVAGSQQGLDLTARLLLDAGDEVWVEDPGYLGTRGALVAAGARLVPVPVDAEGLLVAAGIASAPAARLACVTPSHQYPLGVTLSLPRRLALLAWASAAGAWILEDDYDSEYRYVGRPLAALQGLDADGRVIYVGTFSKVLFPGLRLGYLVVPPDLVDAFTAARALIDRHPPGLEQAALADFIAEGHFSRHLRRTRALYAERQAALVEAAAAELSGGLDVVPAETGIHVVGHLPPGVDDRTAAEAALAAGIEAPALSTYRLTPSLDGGLMLGYAAVEPAAIQRGVERLAGAIARPTAASR